MKNLTGITQAEIDVFVRRPEIISMTQQQLAQHMIQYNFSQDLKADCEIARVARASQAQGGGR